MDKKYQEILDGSREVFMKYGIKAVSMDDVCHELGISKKTIYQYFSNKAHLLESVLDRMHDSGKLLEEVFKQRGLNAIDTLLEVSKMLNDHMKETNPIISFELKKYYPEIYKKQLEKRRNETYRHVKENLMQGISENLYRNEIDVELVASLYIKEMETTLDQDFYCPKKVSFSKIFEVMFEKYIRGIANEKGVKYFEEKKAGYEF